MLPDGQEAIFTLDRLERKETQLKAFRGGPPRKHLHPGPRQQFPEIHVVMLFIPHLPGTQSAAPPIRGEWAATVTQFDAHIYI